MYYVGVDMSSENFTAAVGIEPWEIVVPAKEFTNDPEGFTELVDWMQTHSINSDNMVLCMEATGVYGESLAYFLSAKQYPIAIESPLKVKRAFMPQGHKNDRVDSQQIAEYSYRFYDKLRFWQPREEILEQIKVLLTTREQFTVQNAAHKNALTALMRKVVATPLAKELHQKSIDRFEEDLKEIDAEIQRLIDQNPHYGQMINLLISVPGVGLLLAAHMLIIIENTPNDPINPKQLAAYIGICPYEHRSGSSIYKPDSSSPYGPPRVRKLLYLASLSVRTHRQEFKKYFLRKVDEGKPKKLVLNNIANKLIKIMCAVIRTQTPFIPNYRSIHPSLYQNT